MNCNRKLCRCTHTLPCVAGWLDLPALTRHGVTYERVAPCPICRPEACWRAGQKAEAEARQ
jgi:hypothetical protein